MECEARLKTNRFSNALTIHEKGRLMAYLNLNKVNEAALRAFSPFAKLGFDSSISGDGYGLTIVSQRIMKLQSYKNDIRIAVVCNQVGECAVLLTFGILDRSSYTEFLTKRFNNSNAYFTAYVGPDNVLVLRHAFSIYLEEEMGRYISEFLSNIARLVNDKDLTELAMFAAN